MKRKYIDERFGALDLEHMSNRTVYMRDQEMMDFIYRICVAFSETDNDAFVRFYYGENKPK
jgi:hypothetical protein